MGKGKSLWKRAMWKAVEALSVKSEPLYLPSEVIRNSPPSTHTYIIFINFAAFLWFSFFLITIC